ncbi:tyrosine-type recombinase/integrase [Enterococcus faecalis]|nr:tyrosine-type recombinase/integrase [Enterococcus faecalis]
MSDKKSEKRRDNRNRILNTGESQRENGLYVFKYTVDGKPKFAYSWRLVETDRLPKGKRPCKPLREKEREIMRDIEDGIDHIGKKMTVSQLYAKFIRCRQDVRVGTIKARGQLVRILSEDNIGTCQIGRVKPSDAREWVQRMKEKGFAFSTISNHKRSLKAAFYLAIADDLIRKNPFDFKLTSVIRNDRKPREAMNREQQMALLDFMRKDAVYSRYVNAAVILLESGLRISEMCGLTDADIDFEKRLVSIDHQLVRAAGGGYVVEEPKTESGKRVIYMTDRMMSALMAAMESRPRAKYVNVSGHTSFIFLNKDGLPRTGADYDRVFRGIRGKYGKKGGIALPRDLTPHTLRHTFCTEMAKKGMNPKALQYIMGHKDVKMTLGYYSHMDGESAAEEMQRFAK